MNGLSGSGTLRNNNTLLADKYCKSRKLTDGFRLQCYKILRFSISITNYWNSAVIKKNSGAKIKKSCIVTVESVFFPVSLL